MCNFIVKTLNLQTCFIVSYFKITENRTSISTFQTSNKWCTQKD